jgi:sialate O-acetylesterase
VNFNNQNLQATAASDGSWYVMLPATEAGGPYTIGVADSNGDKIALTNVLFGDVYLCSGQSNMQFTVAQAFNSTYEISLAANYPNIRLFSVGTLNISLTPVDQLINYELGWSVSAATTVGGGDWTYMSAVCWFYGRDLFESLQVPIGLISSNWGGTYIQAWSSPDALAKCNITEKPNPAAGPNPNQPSVLYNAMIVPFLPMTIRGALWYQGEANVGANTLYACAFPAMIADWRTKFGTGFEFPFFFVQLAPWLPAGSENGNLAVALLRTAQLAALTLPYVGYASAIDLGDYQSPFGSIHPRDKQEVGKRLLAAGLNLAYNQTSIVWQGPTFQTATISDGNSAASVTVTFQTYGTQGLNYIADAVACPPESATNCTGWELLLSDGNWYAATSATLASTPNEVTVVYADTSLTSKGIRYCQSIWPLTTIYSNEGLPAIPFSYEFNSEENFKI